MRKRAATLISGRREETRTSWKLVLHRSGDSVYEESKQILFGRLVDCCRRGSCCRRLQQGSPGRWSAGWCDGKGAGGGGACGCNAVGLGGRRRRYPISRESGEAGSRRPYRIQQARRILPATASR